MTASAQLQATRPAAARRTTPRKRHASSVSGQPHSIELRHDAASQALNAGVAAQRLARIHAQMNPQRQAARTQNSFATSAARADPVQRILIVGEAPEDFGRLSQKAKNNWDNALEYLRTIREAVEPDVTLTVKNAEMRGANPAETLYTPPPTEDDAAEISITIANWYLEMASTGELLGMLTHELGVHSLANAEMTTEQREQEAKSNRDPSKITTGTRTYSLAGEIEDDERQMDHVNAVKLQAEDALRARGQRYLDTLLRMGDAVEVDEDIDDSEKTRRQRDLVNTFLFDIGRIVATDDGGAIRKMGKAGVPFTTFLASGGIADVMNWYRDTFLKPEYGEHEWLRQFKDDVVSGTQVAGMLFNKLADYGVARAKTASTTAKMLGGAVGVGALAAGIAFAPVTTLALGGLGLGYGAYRYFWG